MTKEELVAQAEALGVEVDGRWSLARIADEIAKVQAPPPDTISVADINPGKLPEPTIDVVVMRDVWGDHDQRFRAGSVRTVTVAEAMDGVESGIYSRFKG